MNLGQDITANQYQEYAERTINKDLSKENARLHALFEMCSEVGEIHGIFQKHFQGHDIDESELKKECGDLLWGVAELCYAYGWNLSDVMKTNIEKLMERYPDGFSYERSINRPEYRNK